MEANLTFENQSYDVSRSEVILFQQNRSAPTETPVVWKVIRRCGFECTHPFRFDSKVDLVIFDAWGHRLVQQSVRPRQHFSLHAAPGGGCQLVETPSLHGRVGFTNELGRGAVHAFLARNHRAVTSWRMVAPAATVLFHPSSSLSLVAWNGVQEGEEVPPPALAISRGHAHTFDLLGVTSARLLMLGGGWGASAQALRFHLDQVQVGPIQG